MRRALVLAEEAAERGEVPVGAVLTRGDEILAEGYNLRETMADPTAHAELVVLREAARAAGAWRLGGTTLYVTLEPCPMCAGALVNARVARVVYGARDPKAGALDTLYSLGRDPRLNHRYESRAGVLEEACAEALRAFFRARRKPTRGAEGAGLHEGGEPASELTTELTSARPLAGGPQKAPPSEIVGRASGDDEVPSEGDAVAGTNP